MKAVSDSLLQEVTRRLVEQFQPEQIILVVVSHFSFVLDMYTDCAYT